MTGAPPAHTGQGWGPSPHWPRIGTPPTLARDGGPANTGQGWMPRPHWPGLGHLPTLARDRGALPTLARDGGPTDTGQGMGGPAHTGGGGCCEILRGRKSDERTPVESDDKRLY